MSTSWPSTPAGVGQTGRRRALSALSVTRAKRAARLAHMALMVLTLAGTSCDPSPPTQGERRLGAVAAVCPGGPSLRALSVWPEEALLGPASNAILPSAEGLWVVESGANTVSLLTPERRWRSGELDVGPDRNPYDMTVDAQGRRWVTNVVSDTVSVLDPGGRLIQEIRHPSLRSPSGVAAWGEHVYVGNANYKGRQQGYGPASVTVISGQRLEVVAEISLTHKNAHFVQVVQTPQGERLAVVTAGELGFGPFGAQPMSDAALELWAQSDDPSQPARQIFTLPRTPEDPRQGAPGRPMVSPDGRALYLTSATAPSLYKLDLERGRWAHDTSNPLVFDELMGDALHHGVMDARGVLYITSFNRDAMFLWDTRCDKRLAGPIDLGLDASLLEGPHGAAIFAQDAAQTDLYYITSLGGALGRALAIFEAP